MTFRNIAIHVQSRLCNALLSLVSSLLYTMSEAVEQILLCKWSSEESLIRFKGQRVSNQKFRKLIWCTVNLQSHLKETKTKNLVNTIKNESSPHIRQNINLRTTCLELLPFILEVITPTLRPVSMFTWCGSSFLNHVQFVCKEKFMKSVKYDFHLRYLLQVNTQLFSAREKQQLAELIDTMIGYNLTYHQERNFEGQYTYVLDP